MKFKDTKYDQGGVFRCCLRSMANSFEDDDEVENGQITTCACSNGGMILVDGIWIATWKVKKEKL